MCQWQSMSCLPVRSTWCYTLFLWSFILQVLQSFVVIVFIIFGLYLLFKFILLDTLNCFLSISWPCTWIFVSLTFHSIFCVSIFTDIGTCPYPGPIGSAYEKSETDDAILQSLAKWYCKKTFLVFHID